MPYTIYNSQWIWLNDEKYPSLTIPKYTVFCQGHNPKDVYLAQFNKVFSYDKPIKKAVIEVCADVYYRISVNGVFLGHGPACSGGDWDNVLKTKYRYFNVYECQINRNSIEFFAEVSSKQLVYCENSCGQNGFILGATLFFEDGSTKKVFTDRTWQSRKNTAYTLQQTDYTIPQDEWTNSNIVQCDCQLKPSEVQNLIEEPIEFGFSPVTVQGGEKKTVVYEFDKIYSVFYQMEVIASGEYSIKYTDCERDFTNRPRGMEIWKGCANDRFRSFSMSSAGSVKLEIENKSETPLTIKKFSVLYCHYPVVQKGYFECSDKQLTQVYNMGINALKNCMQTIELDSPFHQENLGCAGDYYVSSLMNYLTFNAQDLVRFDLVRIADYLTQTDGVYFHTTYSLIWIMMVKEYILYSGDESVLSCVKTAIQLVLEKMHSYCDQNEIISNPPNYMFVDWLKVDEFSLHHPPKALGQTVLNAFYYGALLTAGKLFESSEQKYSKIIYARAEKLKSNFSIFFDGKERLYFNGLNDIDKPSAYKPENTDKRYFSWHANALAVLFGLADEKDAKDLLRRTLKRDDLIKPQPYFMQFVLDAIYKVGLFDEFGIDQLSRWKYMTKFPKGLVEGWYLCEGYAYDYSHVWGGTPTYQLPVRLAGLEIVEAGFKKIKLNPCLYRLTWAKIGIPTPYGLIKIELNKNTKPIIIAPKEIEII